MRVWDPIRRLRISADVVVASLYAQSDDHSVRYSLVQLLVDLAAVDYSILLLLIVSTITLLKMRPAEGPKKK